MKNDETFLCDGNVYSGKNYMVDISDRIESKLYAEAGAERNQFILAGMLQMDLVMEKFHEHYEEIYADNDQKFKDIF